MSNAEMSLAKTIYCSPSVKERNIKNRIKEVQIQLTELEYLLSIAKTENMSNCTQGVKMRNGDIIINSYDGQPYCWMGNKLVIIEKSV